MIVFGDEYQFTDGDRKILAKKFKSIHYAKYSQHQESIAVIHLKNLISKLNPEFVILNIGNIPADEVVNFLTNLHIEDQIVFMSIEHFLETYLHKCYIPKTYKNLRYLEEINRYSKWQYFQKRAIDYFGLFWLFLFSSYLFLSKIPRKIEEQSQGAIYFRQTRVGLDNKKFECIKFRTMHENSHFDPYTKKNDSRIFPYAKIMRQKRFDELPQMKNILKGDMHLIGPRAEWDILVAEYEQKIPYYNERHLVKPGITGLAQVMYPYGENLDDTRQKLMYDLYYIKHWSIWLEFKIIFKTALTVVKKEGK